jgi:hypothetical protein
MLLACGKKADCLQASEKLACDKEFIITAIQINYRVVNFISQILVDDVEFMIDLVVSVPAVLSRSRLKRFKNSKDFVLKAVERNANVLNHVAASLRQDSEVLAAVGPDWKPSEFSNSGTFNSTSSFFNSNNSSDQMSETSGLAQEPDPARQSWQLEGEAASMKSLFGKKGRSSSNFSWSIQSPSESGKSAKQKLYSKRTVSFSDKDHKLDFKQLDRLSPHSPTAGSSTTSSPKSILNKRSRRSSEETTSSGRKEFGSFSSLPSIRSGTNGTNSSSVGDPVDVVPDPEINLDAVPYPDPEISVDVVPDEVWY